jgi:DNA-binding transcriptional regulator YhcF (GntR family)
LKKPAPPGSAPFAKRLLADQIADNLRQAMARGIWEHQLPTERALSEQMGVSRPVLREALHRLRDEGWLQIGAGHAARILPHRTDPVREEGRRIVFLLARPLIHVDREALLTLDELRKRLYLKGWRFEVAMDQRLRRRHPAPILDALVRHYEAGHWILSSVTREVQAWFQSSSLSAVVLGDTFPGIHLPSVDADHRVIARHAVGFFLGRGHRSIACFNRREAAAGDLAMEAGFLEAFQGAENSEHSVIRHSGEVAEIRLRLKRLLKSNRCPTALLVSHALDTLTILTSLLQWGIKVPEDVSLISRQSAVFFSRLAPSPAYYDLDSVKLAARLLRLIERPTSSGGKIRLLPPLVKGETLAPARKRD